ncbi:MAG: hypothetical protein JJU21_16755 [Salinarimonas sp.]|nr:hypothetical protein [Salinarimonas sp.]
MSGGVVQSGPFAGTNWSALPEHMTRPEVGPPVPIWQVNRPPGSSPNTSTPGAPSQPGTPDPATGTGSSGSSATDAARQQAARDRETFREAMGIAVQGIAFSEGLPTAHESPSRAIARRLPGSPENPQAVMKEVQVEMEVWDERREANRKLMQQLMDMVYRG